MSSLNDIRGDSLINAVFGNPSLMGDLQHLPAAAMPEGRAQAAWATMLALHREGIAPDLVATVGRLSASDGAAELLGMDWTTWLLGLCDGQTMTSMPVVVAEELQEAHRVREVRRKLEYLLAACPDSAAEIQRHLIEIAGAAEPDRDFRPASVDDVLDSIQELREPVIDGLLRRGETMNIIAAAKVGKSWTAYSLLYSIVTARMWLGRFPCSPGRVLLLDNELHKETLNHRLHTIAGAMGIGRHDLIGTFDDLSLRGRLMNIFDICKMLRESYKGKVDFVVIDAFYRTLPRGYSENDNAQMTEIYNEVDALAEDINAAICLIHHSSKGDQSGKAATDVGSGAGAMSRAADTHLVIRPNAEDDCVTVDVRLRSWPKIEAFALRWDFPLWVPADDVDPSALLVSKSRGDQRQIAKDAEGCGAIVESLREHGEGTASQLRKWTGFSPDRLNRLLAMMAGDGRLVSTSTEVRGNQCDQYSLPAHLAGLSGRCRDVVGSITDKATT